MAAAPEPTPRPEPAEAVDATRYARQIRFPALGEAGQARLAASRVAIVGCGALGGVSAMALARAGVGFLRLIDRDLPELSNLPRQVLLDEADLAAGLPKAVAAAGHLQRINGALRVEPVVRDLTADCCRELLADVDLVVDGTDNFETRFLINDFACDVGIPWIYGGAIGGEGRVLTILPGHTACLRCLIPEPPRAGELPTCETAGILGPAAMVVAAVQAAEAIKLLSAAGSAERLARAEGRLLVVDLWEGRWHSLDLSPLARRGCPTCRGGERPWLNGGETTAARPLCGRDAVQIAPRRPMQVDLEAVAAGLAAAAGVVVNPWMVRAEVEPGVTVSVFADGRAIVAGTREESRARAVLARYVGT
jgi:molybdopterin-synthase adenylyltransferase